jgi:hypothetical protein
MQRRHESLARHTPHEPSNSRTARKHHARYRSIPFA